MTQTQATTDKTASIPSSIDPEEVEQFSRIAEEWWDPTGKFKPLHEINPVRIAYIKQQICAHFERDEDAIKALDGLSLVDIGCGGGLICEPMARMGASVTGVDASEKNIKTASLHAAQGGLDIAYQANTAEALASENQQFDVVLALEIIEHVADPDSFVASCAELVKPGGLLVMSTINRTLKSLAMAKIGAEYVLRLLPRGTHDWRKFVKPSEMAASARGAGLEHVHTTGMVINPIRWEWHIKDNDVDVNYLMVTRKPA
ncbi:MAG: bifunctional 3-demethylubiquinol 3-O-methyltransferase/2-polyprenyl-6-hydroxyphenol methylase [Rickettsiales bacterium]|nr:bifunctional 3-demethylubiquinol 3-O-methyltransferase/2-polyprenyl-6-hydroxyphenol methylase [Rickettsiales bacterium]